MGSSVVEICVLQVSRQTILTKGSGCFCLMECEQYEARESTANSIILGHNVSVGIPAVRYKNHDPLFQICGKPSFVLK